MGCASVVVTPPVHDGTYVIRVRAHQFYDAQTFEATNLFSDWVTVTYTTPAQFETPAAPTNLRTLSSTGGRTTITWDAPPATPSTPVTTYGYLVSINGAAPGAAFPSGAYVFCPPQTTEISTPAPGSSTTVQVLAVNLLGNSSTLSASFVVNG